MIDSGPSACDVAAVLKRGGIKTGVVGITEYWGSNTHITPFSFKTNTPAVSQTDNEVCFQLRTCLEMFAKDLVAKSIDEFGSKLRDSLINLRTRALPK